MDLKRVLCIQREVLLEKQKKRSGEKNLLPTGWSHGLGPSRQDGKEFWCRILYGSQVFHIFTSLLRCGQFGPLSARPPSALRALWHQMEKVLERISQAGLEINSIMHLSFVGVVGWWGEENIVHASPAEAGLSSCNGLCDSRRRTCVSGYFSQFFHSSL